MILLLQAIWVSIELMNLSPETTGGLVSCVTFGSMLKDARLVSIPNLAILL